MKSIGIALLALALAGTLAAQGRRGAGQGSQGQRGGRPAQDTNGDGKISKDEWKGPAEAFDRLDSNHDGNITREEMAQGRGSRQGGPRGGPREMDTNGDGKISSGEWKGPQELFGQLDTNHDGYLTPEEMRQNRPQGERGGGFGNLSRMDKNADGKISRDEWQGSSELFDRMDANRDGYLVREEMQRGNRRDKSETR